MEATQPSSPWVVTKDDREAYDKLFEDWDIYHLGFLEEDIAVEVMSRSGLSNEDLEKIWTLSDPGNKRTLDMDEFAVAIHLIYRKLSGYPVPNQLPPEIVSLPTRNFAQSIVTVKSLLAQDAETRENSSAFLQPWQTGVSYLKRRSFRTDSNSANDERKRLKENYAKDEEDAAIRVKKLEELVNIKKQKAELKTVFEAEMAAIEQREKQLQNELELCTNNPLPSLTESPAPTSLPLVVDSNQEKADTRAQPPQHSPIASRAAFPPATQYQAFLSQLSVANSPQWTPLPTPGQASGFPLTNQQRIAQQPDRSASTELTPQHSQSNHPHNRSNNRYVPAGQQKALAPMQRAYEPSGQQVRPQQQQHQYEDLPNSQAPAQSQIQTHPHMGDSPSASDKSSSYHMANNQRNAHEHNYGGNYGLSQQRLQAAGAAPRRTGNALGASEYTSEYPSTYMNEASAHLYHSERPGDDNVHRHNKSHLTYNSDSEDDVDGVDDDDVDDEDIDILRYL